MFVPAALTALFLAAAPALPVAAADLPPASAPAGGTLWLVQPLYPGQTGVVTRTEEALGRLFEQGAGGGEIVGQARLAARSLDEAAVIDCLFGDEPCADPVGALVAAYGMERVVLIKAGQDAAGYRFRVASFQPGSFESSAAESANAALEKALLGALIKVAPLASSLDVRSEPPGAAVFVDGERVGITPLSTQILPGERKLRVELAAHHGVEWVEQVPVRGALSFDRELVQKDAMLLVTAPGATISVDGKVVGTESVEVALAAGTHQLAIARDGHEPWSTSVDLQPGQELRIERELQATGWHEFTRMLAREQEPIYARESYFSLSYDSFTFLDDKLAARSLSLDSKESNLANGSSLWGISGEYGSFGRYFGVMLFGGSYFQTADAFTLGIADAGDAYPASVRTKIYGGSLRLLHPQLRYAVWRFVLGAQAGFVGRLAHVDTVEGADFKSGFLLADVGLDVQGGLKLFLVEGLFVEGAYRHSFTLAGSSDGTQEIRGGLGYAF